jgi:hypothetical protein
MANEIIKVFNTEANAILNDGTGRIDPVAAISGHAGIIANVAAEDIPFYIYKKFYYRFEANEPVTEFHIDWDDGEDNSHQKANIEIIKLDKPDTVAITSHIYTEHKHFYPLIRVKSIDGFLSKWYTNDGKQTNGSGSSQNDYSKLESNTLAAGQNEFSTVSIEKTNSDRINSFLPANLPPIGVLKADKKRVYAGIDNDVIKGNKPLLYAYSTSTASSKPDIKYTLQDSKGAIKEHTQAAANIWNAGSAWVSEAINGDTSGSNTYSAIPSGNYHTINKEQWRLTALDAIDSSGTDSVNIDKVKWTASNNYYIQIWYDNGSEADATQTDADNNAGIRIYFMDSGGNSESLNSSGTGKEPDGTDMVPNTANLSSARVELSNPLSADSILNDLKAFIDANTAGVGGMQLPITCGTVTVSGSNRYLDITRVESGATSDSAVVGISSSHMTFTKQRDGQPTEVTTEFAKKLLRVELDNATELSDTDRVYIKIFDTDSANDGSISDDAVITNETVAILSNGNPIVEIEDANTLYLDGTESFSRASNLSISKYNWDLDKLDQLGGWTHSIQATDADGVSDLMGNGNGFKDIGTKEVSYSFDNNGNTLDSDSRIYPSYRLSRLQVKDNMTDATDSTALDTLTYSAIEHFDDTSYTAAAVEMPSDLESKGLLLYSNRDTDVTATWHDVSTRNTDDRYEIFGSTSSSTDGTYLLRDTSNILNHPRNHLLIAQTEKFDRLFFRMKNNNDIGDTMPTVSIRAYYANGFTWEPLEIIDETQGFKTSGSIKFNMPHDWKYGQYNNVDDGNWVGPIEEDGNESGSTAPKDLWTFNAYAILISINVLDASSRNRLIRCMNVWPYNNSHSQLIKLEDPHHVSLNSIAIAQSISFGRNSKVISVEDKFGKADIRKIGASGGSVRFGGIDLGNSEDDRKVIVGYQKNATPVFLDVEHKSGEKTRFFGLISQVTEDHPAGMMYPKWAVTMNISHILELSSTGAISSDKISIGGALVDDGKYLL